MDTKGPTDGHYRCCRRTLKVLQMDTTGPADGHYRTARNAKGAADGQYRR